MNSKRRFGKVAFQLLYYVVVLFVCSFCSCNTNESQNLQADQAEVFLPPDSVLAGNPIVLLIDTCPLPRKIIVPAKSTGQSIVLKDGELLKLLPPDIKPADFFSPMQNYNTDNGLAMDVVTCAIMDKAGNLWFGTAGGGVSRYDGNVFTNFTTAQGLANNVINCIAEDRTGNLWFGTQGGGVSCYDGRVFTNYTSAQGLANDFVLCIAEDKIGRLWFGTDGGGVSCYDKKSFLAGKGGFITYTTAQGLANNLVRCIIEDKEGNLWFGTDGGGVSCYNDKSTSGGRSGFANYTTAQGLAGNVILSMREDNAGNLWFGTNGGGVSCYGNSLNDDFGRKKSGITGMAGFVNYATEQGLINDVVNCIAEDKAGNMWFGTNAGTSCYDGKSFSNYTTKQGLANNTVYSITESKAGNLWFGTYGGGISRYDGKSITSFTIRQGLANNSVFSILEDKTGNLWFGTYGGGVSRYDGNRIDVMERGEAIVRQTGPDLKKINGIRNRSFVNYTTRQGLAHNFILSIAEDKTGNLWFGTYGGGVSRYDGKSFSNYTTDQGLANNVINSMLEDKAGNLWFGTDGGGISCYDGKSFTNYSTAQGLTNDVVNSIVEDVSGNLWFGTSGGGVSRYDGKSFTNYTTRQGLADNNVWCITKDTTGNLWFGTSGGGVSRYDGKSFINYTTMHGLPDNLVTQAVITREHNILFGTNFGIAVLTSFSRNVSSGLDEKEQKTHSIPAQNNLSNEELKKYTPVFEIYNSSTGYPVKDVNAGQNAMYIDSKGVVWIATGSDKTALVRFDYKALNKNNTPPAVFIRGIKINNEDVLWNDLSLDLKAEGLKPDSSATPANITEEVTVLGKRLSDAERDTMRGKFRDIKFDGIAKFYPLPENLVLPYVHNHITFDFSAIEPARPSLVRYQYILEGYDNDWSPVTDKTNAVFGNMYEGSYMFKLRARSPFGVWSEPIQYKFTVLPPWWRSGWMYAVYSIAFLLTVISIYFYVAHRIRVIRKREEEKTMLNKQISDIEMKALRSQMNPHFIFNVMNSVQDYILENDRVTAQDYLAKFARLMRHVLENSKAENITLRNEIETLKLYVMLEQLRAPGKFVYVVDVEPAISVMDTLIMPMLIQPFIENAIIHGIMHKEGNDGRITLTIKKTNDQLVCMIEDNGIGRGSANKIKAARSNSHTSLAMNVTAERINILNNLKGKTAGIIVEDQVDENKNAAGTKVTLTIPYLIQNN